MSSEIQWTSNQMASRLLGHRYAVSEVNWLVDVFRTGGEMSDSEISGMEKLLEALRHYEFMSEADIETEIHRYFAAKNPR